MNPPFAPATPASDLFESIQKLCHQPGVLGVVLNPPGQKPLVASFDESLPHHRLEDAWLAALECLASVRHAGGPCEEFRWLGRDRTFCIAVGPDGALFGFVHAHDIGPEAHSALDQASRAFQSAVGPV